MANSQCKKPGLGKCFNLSIPQCELDPLSIPEPAFHHKKSWKSQVWIRLILSFQHNLSFELFNVYSLSNDIVQELEQRISGLQIRTALRGLVPKDKLPFNGTLSYIVWMGAKALEGVTTTYNTLWQEERFEITSPPKKNPTTVDKPQRSWGTLIVLDV